LVLVVACPCVSIMLVFRCCFVGVVAVAARWRVVGRRRQIFVAELGGAAAAALPLRLLRLLPALAHRSLLED
jgi:hypothetical protein